MQSRLYEAASLNCAFCLIKVRKPPCVKTRRDYFKLHLFLSLEKVTKKKKSRPTFHKAFYKMQLEKPAFPGDLSNYTDCVVLP